jgi:hypothetical protein
VSPLSPFLPQTAPNAICDRSQQYASLSSAVTERARSREREIAAIANCGETAVRFGPFHC